jgi:hypothetical protein
MSFIGWFSQLVRKATNICIHYMCLIKHNDNFAAYHKNSGICLIILYYLHNIYYNERTTPNTGGDKRQGAKHNNNNNNGLTYRKQQTATI